MTGTSLFRDLDGWNPGPFRKLLAEAGFTADGLAQLPRHLSNVYSTRQVAAARACLATDDSPLATTVRLFLLGDTVELPAAMNLVGWQITELTDIGLLERTEAGVHSAAQLTPIGNHLVAADFPSRQCHPAGDYVMGVGPATRLLADLTPRRSPGRALEIGCGIAWLARALASSGMSVTATDVNPRAIDLARLNGVLSGIDGVDLRQGSLFEPVDGAPPFNLIVANPPYVQSPSTALTFRDAPADGVLSRELIAQIPGRLAPGGLAIMLLNWGHRNDSDWADTPLSWVPQDGLQVWLNRSDCATPSEYTWRWINLDPRFEQAHATEAEVARWLEHFRASGIRRLSAGFLALRKPSNASDPAWIRTDSRSTGELPPNASEDLVRLFENESWLRTAGGRDSPLNRTYRVPEGVQATVAMTLDEGWQRRTIRLQSPGRLTYDGQIDENLLRLLEIVRQGHPPRTLLDELRNRPEMATISDLPERIESLTRELLRYGILTPVE